MAEQTAALQEVVAQLSRVEDRLLRLLVSGWRQAGTESAALQSEADALAELGLDELAARFRAVATATSVEGAMPAIALALASCRLLRARVPSDAPPSEGWKPLASTRKGKEVNATRLVPVGRIALGEGEGWACIRLQGGFVSEWLLLEPPALEPLPAEAGHSRAGLAARLLRGRVGGQSRADDGSGGTAWLRQSVEGHLRWRARYPLGASGDVRLCKLVDASWSPVPEKTDDHLGSLRKAMASGKLKDGQPALGYGGLQAVELDSAESASYAWADSAAADAFRNSAVGRIWALAWVDKGLIAPLVLFAPGGALRNAQLLHLVPGCPREVLRS